MHKGLGGFATATGLAIGGLLLCGAGHAPPAKGQLTRQAAPGVPAPGAPPTAFGHPSLEGIWASNFAMTMEATPKTPELVVPEARAQAVAAAVEAELAELGEKGLDPEVPELIKATDGLPIVRGERRTRLVIQPASAALSA